MPTTADTLNSFESCVLEECCIITKQFSRLQISNFRWPYSARPAKITFTSPLSAKYRTNSVNNCGGYRDSYSPAISGIDSVSVSAVPYRTGALFQ